METGQDDKTPGKVIYRHLASAYGTSYMVLYSRMHTLPTQLTAQLLASVYGTSYMVLHSHMYAPLTQLPTQL